MHLLFSFVGGRGHFLPLVPIAQATQEKEHQVTFVCSAAMNDTVKKHGFEVITMGKANTSKPQQQALLPLDREREDNDLREKFARVGARKKAEAILPII